MGIPKNFELRKLLLANGICPFDEWFSSQSAEDQYMVDSRLLRVRLGSFGEINNVGEGVWELKFRKGAAFRVYYGQVGKEVILLIVGGDKRTQTKDIKKAKELFTQYKREGLKDEKH